MNKLNNTLIPLSFGAFEVVDKVEVGVSAEVSVEVEVIDEVEGTVEVSVEVATVVVEGTMLAFSSIQSK